MNTHDVVKHRTLPILFLLILLCLTGSAQAGSNGFFVTYNSEVEKGELELMLMNDITAPSHFRREEGFGTYLSHMIELEYGITHQLATEFMIEWFEDLESGEAAFTGFRWENRFRLFKRDVPLNPMIYVEYEDLDPKTRYKMEVSGWVDPPYEEEEEEPDRERIIETRLVLSQDFGPVNVAFNWINETDLASGRTAFGYALGAMWMIHGKHPKNQHHKMAHHDMATHEEKPTESSDKNKKEEEEHKKGIGLGLEMYGALGDTKSFGLKPKRQEHYLGPIFMYHFNKHWMTHAQLAIGLSKASDNLVRVNMGYKFF